MILNKPVLMAKIGAPYGVKGEVRVKTFTDDPLALGDYGSLYSSDGTKYKITRMRAAKDVLIVKFKGVNYRDEAVALNATELFIDRSMLPDDTEEDEFYVTDLINLSVVDESGDAVGKIIAVPDFGAGNLLEILPSQGQDGKSWYLEFTQKNVPHVDLENGVVTICLPDEVSEREES